VLERDVLTTLPVYAKKLRALSLSLADTRGAAAGVRSNTLILRVTRLTCEEATPEPGFERVIGYTLFLSGIEVGVIGLAALKLLMTGSRRALRGRAARQANDLSL
jgi:hypothetical protein